MGAATRSTAPIPPYPGACPVAADPGLFVVVAVLAFSFVGDGLRAAAAPTDDPSSTSGYRIESSRFGKQASIPPHGSLQAGSQFSMPRVDDDVALHPCDYRWGDQDCASILRIPSAPEPAGCLSTRVGPVRNHIRRDYLVAGAPWYRDLDEVLVRRRCAVPLSTASAPAELERAMSNGVSPSSSGCGRFRNVSIASRSPW